MHLLHLWLKNSCDQPLTLVIQDREGYSHRHAETIVDMLGVITKVSDRWKAFKLKIGRIRPSLPIQRVLDQLESAETPQLATLAFALYSEEAYSNASASLLKRYIRESPQLTDVFFWSTIDYDPELLDILPYERLAFLSLILVALQRDGHIMETLGHCKNLHALSLSLDDFSHQEQPAQITSIPSLRFINLIDHEHIHKLLNALHLPSLDKLSIHIATENPRSPDVYQAIEDLWTRSECELHTLSLRDLRDNFWDRLIPMFTHPSLRHLKQLRIGSEIGAPLIKFLTIPHQNKIKSFDDAVRGFPLSELESIHLEFLPESTGDPIVSKMVLSRMIAASVATPRVGKIVAVKAGFSSFETMEAEKRFWDAHLRELGKIDRRFVHISGGAPSFEREVVFRDFSMLEGFKLF